MITTKCDGCNTEIEHGQQYLELVIQDNTPEGRSLATNAIESSQPKHYHKTNPASPGNSCVPDFVLADYSFASLQKFNR